jgi:hypothetical protein
MKLFWEHGFESTSTDDLEAAPAERSWAALAQPLRPACIKASRLCVILMPLIGTGCPFLAHANAIGRYHYWSMRRVVIVTFVQHRVERIKHEARFCSGVILLIESYSVVLTGF